MLVQREPLPEPLVERPADREPEREADPERDPEREDPPPLLRREPVRPEVDPEDEPLRLEPRRPPVLVLLREELLREEPLLLLDAFRDPDRDALRPLPPPLLPLRLPVREVDFLPELDDAPLVWPPSEPLSLLPCLLLSRSMTLNLSATVIVATCQTAPPHAPA